MIPTGIITLWFGAIVDVPAGWVYCDGNNGTPDLRARFIIGAGPGYAVNDTGGDASHNHTLFADTHGHSLPAGTNIEAGTGRQAVTTNVVITGETFSSENIPPYHALAYIMKT